MKRIIAWLLCLNMLLLPACSDPDAPYIPTGDALAGEDEPLTPQATAGSTAQELVLAYYPNQSLNPYLCIDYTNRTVFSLLYQSLFATDRNYKTTPILCSRYTMTEDMRSYTFYVENATFSDGTPISASDVLASYEAAKTSDYYKGRFSHISSISLSEDGGITFSLSTACENLPILLDIPIVKATEVAAETPLGTGPYYLEQASAGLRLRRRTDWWCQGNLQVSAAAIPLTPVDSVTGIRDAFEYGDVGLVCADPGSADYADYRSDYELWDCESGIFLYLGCNLDSPIFSIPALRANLTHAIDRDGIVAEFYRNFAHSACLPASPNSPYYSNQLASNYSYDSAKFSQAVSEAGVTGQPLRLLVNKNDTLRLRVARKIGQMLSAAGFAVELLEQGTKDYQYTLSSREYDLYLGQTKLSATMDLSAFFSSKGALRYGGLSDAAMNAMCMEALANKGNYLTLHKMVMDDGRICPILFRSYSVLATRGLLTGLTPSRDNVFFYSVGKTTEEIFVQPS